MEYEFQTTIESADVTITFDYQPEESMVLYYSDGSGYPGCAASVDNISVNWFDFDITDLMEQLGHDIEELCFNHIETLAQ
jgi:hypothetical protein